jgi:hypothetical protein
VWSHVSAHSGPLSPSESDAPPGAPPVDEFLTAQRRPLARPVVEESPAGAAELAELYWREVERATLGIVRARGRNDTVSLVLARAVTLFVFGIPSVRAEEGAVACTLPILGGLLVERAGGELTIVQRTEPPEAQVVVSGYRPRLASGTLRRLRRLVYVHAQARVHSVIGERFLAALEERAA